MVVLGRDTEGIGAAGSRVAGPGGTGWGSQAAGDTGDLGVVSLAPPLAGLGGAGQGTGARMGETSGRAGDRKEPWWWDEIVVEWDCGEVAQ